MELIPILIILGLIGIIKLCVEAKFDACDTSNVSIGKLAMDHKSSCTSTKIKMAQGKFNKDDKFKI